MRLLEWKERKRMGKEEDMMRVKVTAEEKKMIVEEEAEKSRMERDKQREEILEEVLNLQVSPMFTEDVSWA